MEEPATEVAGTGGAALAPEPSTSVTLRLTGARPRVGPASWGQLHMLRHFAAAGDNGHFFNASGLIPVPGGCDLRRVLNAVCEILERHETLRTTCQPDGSGARQTVAGEGELAVGLHESSAEHAHAVAERVAAHLSARAFGSTEWPVRFAVVLNAGRPVVVVVAYSHLALDGGGAQVVAGELAHLLAGGELGPPPAWQPIDQAEHERSPAGRALNEQAMDYLREVLQSAPASMFDFPARRSEGNRAVVLEVRSPAAMAASAALADRLRVSGSSVLLAAVAVLLGLYSGRTTAVLHLVSSNRNSEPQRSLAGNLALDAVCHVDFTGLSFEQAVRRTFEASISTYLGSQCDPADRWAMIDKQTLDLGRHICLSAAFNDGRVAPLAGDGAADEPLERLLRRTEVIEHDSPFGGGRFYIEATGAGTSSKMMFVGDAWYVPHEAMREMVHGFERLLVTAASRDIPSGELPAVAGVQPVRRGPDWVRCRDGYVDLAATRELWRAVAGTDAAEIFPEAVEGSGHRLVGYLCAPGDDRSIADLHRDFMSAVGDSTSVRAPDWYVRTGEAPASRAERADWSGLSITAEGRGR